MTMENNGNEPPSLLLWHGTRTTDPVEVILKGAGLTTAYANDGMWGKGIYFAVNANYSCPNYSWRVPGQNNVF
jgi:Poly(ADP-ribose) polymerase catalytic domain